MIDDDEINLMLCEMVLAQNAFAQKIIKLHDGQQGIDFYQDHATQGPAEPVPNLILLDLNMPIMNGWDFLDEFSAHYLTQFPKTRVVILSSSIDPLDVARAGQYPFVIEFLNKPLTDQAVHQLTMNQQLKQMLP